MVSGRPVGRWSGGRWQGAAIPDQVGGISLPDPVVLAPSLPLGVGRPPADRASGRRPVRHRDRRFRADPHRRRVAQHPDQHRPDRPRDHLDALHTQRDHVQEMHRRAACTGCSGRRATSPGSGVNSPRSCGGMSSPPTAGSRPGTDVGDSHPQGPHHRRLDRPVLHVLHPHRGPAAAHGAVDGEPRGRDRPPRRSSRSARRRGRDRNPRTTTRSAAGSTSSGADRAPRTS
jgi:hypothetical protein